MQRRLIVALVLLPCLAVAQAPPNPVAAGRLFQAADLTYVGAFRLPSNDRDDNSFDYGGPIAYLPGRDSLLAVGHDWFQKVAEVDIPAPAQGGTAADLPVAPIRQALADVLEGGIGRIGEGTAKIGGLLPWGDGLLLSAYLYYDASASQTQSHFRSTLDFSRSGDVSGPYRVGPTGAGWVSGYMTSIPEEWRASLGGPALTGQCCLSIIGRTSFGPSVSVFDPADLGVKSPAPAKLVLGYPAEHPTLGGCEETGPLFNCTTTVAGVVFPAGSRSVLFFGRHGLGKYCYGDGGPDGPCIDPASSSKGTHGYPYTYQVWAYDALDLAAVKAGRVRAWAVKPYRTWTFDLPFPVPFRDLVGVAYDERTRRIFLSTGGENGRRIVHVLRLPPPGGSP